MTQLLKELCHKDFANGTAYAMSCLDGYPIEITDTFLPTYTKDCAALRANRLTSSCLGDRSERWMIGVSVMSGCPVGCKFCATGQLNGWRCLSSEEIVAQVQFAVSKHPEIKPNSCFEFKINYTRMGEPMLNVYQLRKAIREISSLYPNAHHYVSTIGICGMDTGWVRDNITLQLSLHSLDNARRDDLIPFPRKLSIHALGRVRTNSNLKTTLNMTLVDEADFDISILRRYFDPDYFFIKLSPINPNAVSDSHSLGSGIIQQTNIL